MTTPLSESRGTRSRKSVNYVESPVEQSANVRKSSRKSVHRLLNSSFIKENTSDDDSPVVDEKPSKKSLQSKNKKTPKKASKSARKAEAEPTEYSPKKLRRNPSMSRKGLEATVLESSPTVAKIDTPSSRRSAKKPEPSCRDIKLKISSDEDELPENFEVSTSEKVDKPTTLFIPDEDVDGQALFPFKTPKKKDSMAMLAQQHTPKTPRLNGTPKTPSKTPKSSRLSEHSETLMKTPTSRPSAFKLAKTPTHVRAENKKKLSKHYDDPSEDEFTTDESDKNSDESSKGSSDDEVDDQSPPKKALSVTARLLQTPAATTRRSVRNKGDYNFVLQSDDYFSSAGAKAKTSNHTLDHLKNPRLPHDQLIKLLSNMKLSKEHEEAVKGLNEEYKNHFDKWLTLFDQGYTVLLHGFGSKINLLQSFHKEKLAKRHVIVINGFFPSLTIKDVLDAIWVDLLEQSSVGGNPHEIVNMIEQDMKDIPALHLFLIIHNLDGTMLRNDKAQSVLSRLASIKNIHMIASIDHINAPLLWNNTKLSNYNFAWFDVTSFLPYTEETAFEDSLMVQNSGALELSSMKSVFQSLTTNARGIYKLVVNYQLKNGSSPNYQGISFKELYSCCRDAFLVSSEVALRAQLTEFLDHKLAKLKRTIDGSENITIPIKNHLLEQFLSEQN